MEKASFLLLSVASGEDALALLAREWVDVAVPGTSHRCNVGVLSCYPPMPGSNSLVADLRRQGLLRASRYDFRIGALREMVRLLGRLHDALGLEPRWRDYLASVDALHHLAADAKRLRDALLSRLSNRRGRALKTFLVMANQAFAARTQVPTDAEIGESSTRTDGDVGTPIGCPGDRVFPGRKRGNQPGGASARRRTRTQPTVRPQDVEQKVQMTWPCEL